VRRVHDGVLVKGSKDYFRPAELLRQEGGQLISFDFGVSVGVALPRKQAVVRLFQLPGMQPLADWGIAGWVSCLKRAAIASFSGWLFGRAFKSASSHFKRFSSRPTIRPAMTSALSAAPLPGRVLAQPRLHHPGRCPPGGPHRSEAVNRSRIHNSGSAWHNLHPAHLSRLRSMGKSYGLAGAVTGGGSYLSGSLRKVAATAAPGWLFVNWTEDGPM